MFGATALAVILAVAWLAVFLSGRRFGVLGLALAAGAILSSLWARQLALMLGDAAVPPFGVALANLVPVLLVIAPAAFLLLRGPSYKGPKGRLVGATLFTVLALALVAEPLGELVALGSFDRAMFGLIADYRVYILTAGLVVAVFDMLKHPKNSSRR